MIFLFGFILTEKRIARDELVKIIYWGSYAHDEPEITIISKLEIHFFRVKSGINSLFHQRLFLKKITLFDIPLHLRSGIDPIICFPSPYIPAENRAD